MRSGLVLTAAAAFVFAVASCSSGGPCGGANCGPGLFCDLVKDKCVPLATDAGHDAGPPDAGQAVDAGPPCGGACPLQLPYCDVGANKCRRCLPDAGCGGSTPVCDTGAYLGEGGCVACLRDRDCSDPLVRCHVAPPVNACVECLSPSDCVVGACDFNTFSCTDAG